MLSLYLKDPHDTYSLGKLFGERLKPGAVVALTGHLGAGKTCFTQGLARGLGIPEEVPVVSPTFTLVNEYPGRASLFHLDVYRLDGDEFTLSGLDEYFEMDGVTVIEWAEKIRESLPIPRIEIDIRSECGGRRADIVAVGGDFEAMVEEIGRFFSQSMSSLAKMDDIGWVSE